MYNNVSDLRLGKVVVRPGSLTFRGHPLHHETLVTLSQPSMFLV